MKKLFFIMSLVVVALTDALGQQVPLYSQYMYDPMIYNPAKTGWEGRYNLNFIYRRQFAGIKGGPETRAFTFDMPVMSNKAGIGAYVFDDQTNIFRRTAGYLQYAYHINFKEDNRLSIGLAAGVQSVRVNMDKVVVIDPTDVLIANGRERNTYFDANFGINYFYKGLNIGVSVPQILNTDLHYLNDQGERGYSAYRHYIATASYDAKVWQNRITITPMVLFRTTEALDWQIEGGVNLMYKDFVWINSMYRYNYGVTVGGGFKIHDLIKIGYSYDHGLNDLKGYTNGNHEITLGITIAKRKHSSGIEDSTLAKKLSQQDSLIAALQSNMDSLNTKTDSLAKVTDDLSKRVDTLSSAMDSLDAIFGGEDQGGLAEALKNFNKQKIDSLMQRLDDLEKKFDKGAADVKKQAQKSKDALNEMQEERTRVVDEQDLEYKHGAPLGSYFMVVGSFRVEQNSYKLEDELDKQGFQAGVVFDKKRQWYYVYLSEHENKDKGLEALYKLREENPRFHDAWIHIMSKAVR